MIAKGWHRVLGIGASLFVLLLATTGIVLAHVDDLNLGQRYVTAGWLLDLYGISTVAPTTGFTVGEKHVIGFSDAIYLDDRLLADRGPAVGAVRLGDRLVIGTPRELLVHSVAGELIETLPTSWPIVALGGADGNLVARTPTELMLASLEDLSFEPLAPQTAVEWSLRSSLGEGLAERVNDARRSRVLSFERVILDLHSGRILGEWGVWLFDLVAVALVVLAITGFVLWLRGSPPVPPRRPKTPN